METEDPDRQRVKLARPTEPLSPKTSEPPKKDGKSRPGAAFGQFLLWMLLLAWFAAVFVYRTVPGDGVLDKISALRSVRKPKLAEKIVESKPAAKVEPAATVPQTVAQPKKPADDRAVHLTALAPKLAKAFAAGDVKAAFAAVGELPDSLDERRQYAAFLKQLPRESDMVMRLMDKNVGKEIRLSRNGRTRMVTLRAITEQTLYIELHGRPAEISLSKLTADDLLPLMSRPETPPDALVYTLMLLRSRNHRGEVADFAEKCPLFKQALLDADKLVPAPSAPDSQGE